MKRPHTAAFNHHRHRELLATAIVIGGGLMPTISRESRGKVARTLRFGIRSFADRRGQTVTGAERNIAERLGISARTLQSWTNPSSMPDRIDDGLFLGLAWLIIREGEQDLSWLIELLRATSIPVPDIPSPGWVRACFRNARVGNLPPPESEVERVLSRLFARDVLSRNPTPGELRAYLELLVNAFGYWRDLFVIPETVELREVEEPPRRIGRFPWPVYECVYEREDEDMVTREPIAMPLSDWLMNHHHLALLAVPGGGKSTMLERMVWELASYQLDHLIRGRLVSLELPVLLPLEAYGGEAWPEFLPRGIVMAITRALLRYGDWTQRGLCREDAERESFQRVREVLEPLSMFLEQLRQEGRLILLLDSLNELRGGAEGPLRPLVEEFIAESREKGNRVAVACRMSDYTRHISRLHRVELLPFDERRIRQALIGYLGEHGHILWEELARPENRELQEMLAIPLYIEVLGFPGVLEVDEDGRPRLPTNRGTLLARFVRVLLTREWERVGRAKRPTVPVKRVVETLAEVAYRMRDERGSRGSQIDRAAIQSFLAEALAFTPDYKPDWVLDLAAGAGLIDLGREDFSFWKEPLEEYFAACHLLARFADGYINDCQKMWYISLHQEDVAMERRDMGEPPTYPQVEGAWEETTILAAGLAGIEERRVSPDQFVMAVLAANPGLAGRCIYEGGAQVSSEVREKVVKVLLTIMQDHSFSVRARVPCGVLVGRLGDPRFHDSELFCLPREPLLGFVEIPAGPFYMGSDSETVAYWNRRAGIEAGLGPGLFEDELGHEGPIDLPYKYWIGRYPVTNAQFFCFVKDGGYTERWKHCWTTEGWFWLNSGRWPENLDRFWRWLYDFSRKRGRLARYKNYAEYREKVLWRLSLRMYKDEEEGEYWRNVECNVPNQPVIGLSWYETVAYANWLTEKLRESPKTPNELRKLLKQGYRIHLASEAEWEKAARGGVNVLDDEGCLIRNPYPKRQWPWGDVWDPMRCNVAEGSELVCWVNPVGMYLDGESPYGCLEMSGNVWEWTRSLYASYPYDYNKDNEWPGERVVRGGSWRNSRRVARCANRRKYPPAYRNVNLGMRLVCVPSF